MNIPKKIKVGSLDYSVSSADELRSTKNNELLWGHCDFKTQEIKYIENLKPARLIEILMHETTHAMLEDISLTLKDEERVCIALGKALPKLIKDNPQLIKYVQKFY